MRRDTEVPTTVRDFFFEDPFFKSSWENFEKLREKMFEESKEWWKQIDQDFRPLMFDDFEKSNEKREKKSSSMMSTQQKSSNEKSRRGSLKSQRKISFNEDDKTLDFWDDEKDWMMPFPRKYMMPSFFKDFKDMDIFQSKDSEVIRVKEDDAKMEVSLDTSQYRPDELSVSVSGGVVTIEGKHEEKAEDGSKMVSRQFTRKYTLPSGAKPENVLSNLSSDGVLVVTAKKAATKAIDVKIRKH